MTLSAIKRQIKISFETRKGAGQDGNKVKTRIILNLGHPVITHGSEPQAPSLRCI